MRAVKTEFIRICVVFGVMLAIAIWQFDFVIGAIGANPALNLIIFATFFFGLFLVGSCMHILRNEYRALYALMECYDDIRNEKRMAAENPLWRYYRCVKVGIVFDKPKILGQSYQLIMEQLARDRELKISASTMHTLTDGIDSRLIGSKSLVSYVAGTLIFLGLIGTFIGLMVTLSSVGEILGSLDLSGGDPAATVSNLMTNLQTPLGGMATGFSSSLFGLLTSLTISMMFQMLGRAGGSLKTDFSDWVTNVVELSETAESIAGRDPAAVTAAFEERRLALLMRTARYVVNSNRRQSGTLEELRDNVSSLTDTQRGTQASIEHVVGAMQVLSEQNKILHSALARSVDALNAVAVSTNIREEVAELTAMMAAQSQLRDANVLTALQGMQGQLSDFRQQARPAQSDEEEAVALDNMLAQDTDELNVSQINKLLAAVYRRELGNKEKLADTPQSESIEPAAKTGEAS